MRKFEMHPFCFSTYIVPPIAIFCVSVATIFLPRGYGESIVDTV